MVFPTFYHGFTTTPPIIMIARSQSRSARTYSALDRWLLSSLNILEPLGLRPLPLVFALRHHTSYYNKYFTSATTSVARDGVSSLSAYAYTLSMRNCGGFILLRC